MKWITFAVAFVLTACLVIAGVALYPNIFGQAATVNNQFVFTLFLGPFCVVLFFAWVGEKVAIKLTKSQD
jgi:hypothetical protein